MSTNVKPSDESVRNARGIVTGHAPDHQYSPEYCTHVTHRRHPAEWPCPPVRWAKQVLTAAGRSPR